MKSIVSVVVVLIVSTVGLCAERPANPGFRMEPTRIMGKAPEGVRPGEWVELRESSAPGKEFAKVDKQGNLQVHVMNSSAGFCPVNVQVENGELVVRHEGRMYVYSPAYRRETLNQPEPLVKLMRPITTMIGLTREPRAAVFEDTQWVERD